MMRKAGLIILLLVVVVFSFIGFSFVVARLLVPSIINGEDSDRATAVAVEHAMREKHFSYKSFYLSIDRHNPQPELMQTLKRDFPGIEIKPVSQRSRAPGDCPSSPPGMLKMVTCEDDDYIAAQFLTMP